jgi:hypothetical protein
MAETTFSKSSEDRGALISAETLALGARWARTWCDDMRQHGRPIAGGWPGTLPEARSRVRTLLDTELEQRGLAPLSVEELLSATLVTYQEAKREWLKAVRELQPRASAGVLPGRKDEI